MIRTPSGQVFRASVAHVPQLSWRILPAVLLLTTVALPFVLRAQGEAVSVAIDYPKPGSVITNSDGLVLITGRVHGEVAPQDLDLVFVIDVSDSTARPSGADVDGDGTTGQQRRTRFLWIFSEIVPLSNTDPGDSVLSAEVAAVETLLEQFDPRATRVGIVQFAGDLDPLSPDAATQVALTTNYEWVRDGLDDIVRYGPHGRTNMLAGVNIGTIELLGTKSAHSERRPDARKVMIFLTDGTPTLPVETSPNQNARLAIRAAKVAARHNIRIDTYAIGKKALSEPVVPVEMARVTHGVFTPVVDPSDLRSTIANMNLSDVRELLVENMTNGRRASLVTQGADGSLSALAPVDAGRNLIRVTARSAQGLIGLAEVEVEYREGPGPGPMDDWHSQVRARLLGQYELIRPAGVP